MLEDTQEFTKRKSIIQSENNKMYKRLQQHWQFTEYISLEKCLSFRHWIFWTYRGMIRIFGFEFWKYY